MLTQEHLLPIEVSNNNGIAVKRNVLIRTLDGHLMTRRLQSFLLKKEGTLIEISGRTVSFKRVAWEPPYTILKELVKDFQSLQSKLREMGKQSNLATIELRELPPNADSKTIDKYVLTLLELRKGLKAEIRAK